MIINNKNCSIVVLSVATLFLLSSCNLIPIERHYPSYLNRTKVLFEDYAGNCYFKRPLCKYSFEANNHYEVSRFYEDESAYGYGSVTANSEYMFLRLMTYNEYALSKMVVYDKKLNLVDEFSFSEISTYCRGMACNDKYLYWREEDFDSNVITLYKYSIEEKVFTILSENKEIDGFYIDNENYFFFDKDNIIIYSDKTPLLYTGYKDGTNGVYTDKLSLKYDKKTIVFTNNGVKTSYKKDWDFNLLFKNAYLIDEYLIFAGEKRENDYHCGQPSPSNCICGYKGSYLFTLNLKTSKLDMIREFPSGTVLIDFDLDHVEYYYNGGLYIDDCLQRKCEEITVGQSKKSQYMRFNEYKLEYHISYYNGTFYGI